MGNFESTYKELKQSVAQQTDTQSYNFESTYKELKPCLQIYASDNIRHFESTYKELKLVLKFKHHFFCSILSLPIRN